MESRDKSGLIVATVGGFVVGVAVTASILYPEVRHPEYVRGHRDGYAAGYADAGRVMRDESIERWQNPD